MASSEHPLQQHRSGWPLCAIWYPYVAGDQKANSKSQVPRWGYFFGGEFSRITVPSSGFYLTLTTRLTAGQGRGTPRSRIDGPNTH